MTIRTTVAFDPVTATRLERLAKRWGISKSETLRRALEAAEKADNGPSTPSGGIPDFTRMTPLEIVQWLRENPSPTVPGGWGDDPHRELRERDAEIEDEREKERLSSTVAEPRTLRKS